MINPFPTRPRAAGRSLLTRLNVDNLSREQLRSLRHAFAALKRTRDDRGYDYHAGKHGLPLPMLCQHGTRNESRGPLFLPWHRAYLYFFELALGDALRRGLARGEVPEDVSPEVALPWWDWAAQPTHPSGIPMAFAAREVDGRPNPLYSARLPAEAQPEALPRALERAGLPYTVPRGWDNDTFRRPGRTDRLPTRSQIRALRDLGTYRDFHSQLETGVHNQIHRFVGGTMTFVEWSAYDPLFWAHHANVDRLWYLWQIGENGTNPGPTVLDQALPLGKEAMTVRQTLQINELGYDYASSGAAVAGNREG